MKNMFYTFLLLISSIAGANYANAGDPRALLNPVRLIEIKAEYYPGETYYLGYAENEDHTINSIFYENNEHVKRFYSFKDLNQDVAIIQTTSGNTVYDLVRINVRPAKVKNSYKVEMSYMKNGLFKNRKTVGFSIVFNKQRQVYELIDSDSGELINRSYVTTNYWGSLAVGISSINSSK